MHACLMQVWVEKGQDMKRAALGPTNPTTTRSLAEHARMEALHGSKQAALEMLNRQLAEMKAASGDTSEGAASQLQLHTLLR